MAIRDGVSANQLAAALDRAPAAVFIYAAGSNRLLYANCLAKELFPDGMEDSCLRMQEFHPSGSERLYQRTEEFIDWEGEKARVEYVTEITDRRELDHLVNSIPGGIAGSRKIGDRFVLAYYTDGVPALSGHTREEYDEALKRDTLAHVYEPDRERLLAATRAAYESGEVLDISYRVRHKNGNLVWIRLNGRRIGAISEEAMFYAVFTGMSAESNLYQNIANETDDSIFVIDKENYELLYANKAGCAAAGGAGCIGRKCYEALYGNPAPCSYCTLGNDMEMGREHEMESEETGHFYRTHFRELWWNGIPAYIKYVRDITEEVKVRREKERLEMYFKTLVDMLPGGASVIYMDQEGRTSLEFISDGFASMMNMTMEELHEIYGEDILAGVHQEDVPAIEKELERAVRENAKRCEIIGRMKRGGGGYVWVKNTLSVKQMEDGSRRLYCAYTDISREMEAKEALRRKYEDLIMQHYRSPGPDTLVVGHCNITKNKILEIRDYTDSDLLETLGDVREEFFDGISRLVVDEKEQERFRSLFLSAPMLAAYESNDIEQLMDCFIRLPYRNKGCYARFKVHLVKVPDTGDVTGILTVTDITEQAIADRILHRLSVAGHEYVLDLNLADDFYKMITRNEQACCIPPGEGIFSEAVSRIAGTVVAPKDRSVYKTHLDTGEIRRRLRTEGAYTFTYSVIDQEQRIHVRNMTVFYVDTMLERVCICCTDITDSVHKQQGLLNMIAYTFDLAGFIHVDSGRFTMYTRQTILENLPPYVVENYAEAMCKFAGYYEEPEKALEMFSIEGLMTALAGKPAGYDFVLPHQSEEGICYKQINVLWGDQNHELICIVRADVTEMLAAERQSQKALEQALLEAEQANRAKSSFLSAMSHDIRTPMNAIMGMTALAKAHLDSPGRVEDCLKKISIASRHLLSLINDVLDMSKIERSQISLSQMPISLPDLLGEITAIIIPQAEDLGLQFAVKSEGIVHETFTGDSLRLSQILINLLSNGVKFTPAGGQVELSVREIQPETDGRIRYCFTVSDTGVGMSETFLAHIYDPFTRDTHAAQIEGTGLGLSITKGLIDLMGGRITVASRLGTGSEFRVELEFDPAWDSARPGSSTADNGNSGKSLSGLRFLVAEDNAINAEILCEVLGMQEAQCEVVPDGQQVVQVFRDREPGTFDAILMDIQMPVMNGYEAARLIRGLDRPDGRTIPIVAMTANAFAEDIKASGEAGMDAHIAKPLDVELLCRTLHKLLAR